MSLPIFWLLVGIGVIVALNIHDRRITHDGTWHRHGLQMRRRIKGEWQYRPMTEEEELTHKYENVW